jgi:hypothetical protein
MLALTSPTGGGRSVGIVRSRTQATEFFSLVFNRNIIRFNYHRHLIIATDWTQVSMVLNLATPALVAVVKSGSHYLHAIS